MNPTAAWLSVTGSVFGMAHTAVNPPATAARVPLAMVSTSSFPGSRKCTCTSTRPGVHDSELARRRLESLDRDAEDPVVLAQGRDEPPLHALQLQSQHVQHVGPFDRFLDAPEPAHAELLDAARHQGVGPAHAHFGAELQQPPDVGTGHARVQDVAHQTDFEPGDLAVAVADREQIEQRLGGVLVLAGGGVDDVGANAVAEELRGSRRRMPDHHHVDPHRLEVLRGVDERLALLHRAAGRGHVHRVGREALFGELEGDARTGGGLEEQVDDGLAAQGGHLLDGALGYFLERLGGVEDEADLLGGEGLQPNQVLAERGRHPSPPPLTRSTASRPSSSSTSASTRSWLFTFTCFPTMSGWIGSSRPPRSTSTHNEMRLGRPKSASSSSAARTVRPVKSTSSTITTCLPVRSPGRRVSPITGFGAPVWRSSRYRVMSRAPRGTATLSCVSICLAIRSASSTPRRWMPIRSRSSVPCASSSTSTAIR